MRWILTCLLGLSILAVTGAAQGQTYRLRPGDILDVIVFQDPKLNRQVVVAPDGQVAFPLAGRFKAGGLTTEAVETELKSRLQKQFTTDLDVTVSYVQSEKREPRPLAREAKPTEFTVYVTGEVAKPGAFVVPKRPPTVLQAIALSGGLGPFAAPRRIHVVRNINGEDVALPFNYKPYEKGSDNLGGNIRLRNGDVVVVPERGLFE
ncbi:MAG TPA: polysaccharide biosynthesis/export family protein [Aestuariivirga sp.]|nr:polysaccharide biosynthesis/export family protein [Aestuariivirga sp.]